MKNKWKNIWRGDGIVNFSSSILAIVCGLLFGFIILLSSNPRRLLWIYDDPSGRIYRRNPGNWADALSGNPDHYDRAFCRICI